MGKYIGVSCDNNPRNLWLHLNGIPLAKPPFNKVVKRTDQLGDGQWRLRISLTPTGYNLVNRFFDEADALGLDPAVIVTPKKLCLEIPLPLETAVERWGKILPVAVRITREVTGMSLPLQRERPSNPRWPEWHLPLLRELGAKL